MYVNEKLFADYVKSKFETKVQSSDTSELTDVDLNALRYVAGFVPWKLKQKFSKPGCKIQIVEITCPAWLE